MHRFSMQQKQKQPKNIQKEGFLGGRNGKNLQKSTISVKFFLKIDQKYANFGRFLVKNTVFGSKSRVFWWKCMKKYGKTGYFLEILGFSMKKRQKMVIF